MPTYTIYYRTEQFCRFNVKTNRYNLTNYAHKNVNILRTYYTYYYYITCKAVLTPHRTVKIHSCCEGNNLAL